MSLRAAFIHRVPGAIAIAGLFALQSVYELFFCGGGVVGFWSVTTMLAVPAAIVLALMGSTPTMVMCATLIPFILWANAAECAPYQGGGAAMAYVVVFMFGVPTAFAVATGVAFFRRRKGGSANAS
jgi:hypothetical protein